MSVQGRKRERDDYSSGSGSKRRSNEEEGPVSTLHVSGLPADVRDRELRLLATFLPGLEGAVISRGTGKTGRSTEPESQIGFIKFSSQAFALAGAHALHGMVFDDKQPDNTLRVSLARRNMNIRATSASKTPQYPYPFPNQMNYASMYSEGMQGMAAYGGQQAAAYAGQQAVAYGGQQAVVQEAQGQYDSRRESTRPAEHGQGTDPMEYTISTRANDDPCDTLCIRGLPYPAQQQDLEGAFTHLAGFREMKSFSQKGLAFVAFETKDASAKAMSEIEGNVITLPGSTGRETVLVEYARRSLNSR